MPVITLKNDNWQNGVNVDVRIGPYLDPNQNPSEPRFRLDYQQQWARDTGTNDLCYRRDNDPDNPDGTMTPWTVVSSVNGDQTEEV